MKGDFDHDAFRACDKRTLKELNTNSRKCKILSNHPGNSFRICDETGEAIILISDPELFWSLTNYLVVQTD